MSESEARIKLAEIITGKQRDAETAIEDVTEIPIELMTIREALDFIIESAEPLNPFWR